MTRTEFAGLYEEYQPRLRAWIGKRVCDPELADDLAADSFLRALGHLDSFQPRPGATVGSWLYVIAANVIRDHWRRMKARPTTLSLDEGLRDDDGDSKMPIVREVPAEDWVPHFEDRLLLEEALAAIQPRYRRLLIMFYVQQMTAAEMAMALGRSIQTLYRDLRFARGSLRAALEHGPMKPPPGAPARSKAKGQAPADDDRWPEWFDQGLLREVA